MKPKVLTTLNLPKEVMQFIEESCQLEIADPESRSEVLEKIADADGFLTSKDPIDDELLSAAKKLKVVSDVAVGYDNFDVEALKKHQVLATHTPYVLDETVADTVFGLVLSIARRMPEMDRLVKEGNWNENIGQPLFGTDVHGKTMGIIGMGRIGEKVARRAVLGFGMNVLYYTRSRKEQVEQDLGVKRAELEALLEQSDFVVLLTPLTDETYHLIGEKEFGLMKKTAYLINAARGAVVDESAMIKALQEGQIAGCGLDVFEQEPVEKTNPLLKMDNVVTMPHIGSATAQTRFDMAMAAAKNVVAGASGQRPENVIKELDKERI